MATVPKGPKPKTVRVPTPIWLTNTDYPAPCSCGRPFSHEDTIVLAEEGDLKRLMHLNCAMEADKLLFDE